MKFTTILKKTPLTNILLVGVGFLLVILHIFKKQKHVEGFQQEEKFVLKKMKKFMMIFMLIFMML